MSMRRGRSIFSVLRAKYCIRSSTGAISIAIASPNGLPDSAEISFAMPSMSARITARARITRRFRSAKEVFFHMWKISRDRSTAE